MHRVLYNESSQTLRHVPSERVTSATYVIEDLTKSLGSSDRELASGSATVDGLSLTTDAAAGSNTATPDRVPVSSTTGAAAGDVCVIVDPSGFPWEAFTVEGLEADDYLKTRHPIVGEYPSGSAVYGVLVSAAFPDVAAADEQYVYEDWPLRVTWEYTIGGDTVKVNEPIRVVRQRDGESPIHRVEELLRDGYPEISEMLYRGNSLRRYVQFCEQDLRARMLAKGVRPDRFSGGEQYAQALMYRTVLHAASNGYSPGNIDALEFREDQARHFEYHWQSLMVGEPGKDVVETNATDDTAPRGSSRRYRSPIGAL
jgi:hypothetical protein